MNKNYNVFAHAVYDSLRTTYSEASLEGAIASANKMFAPICISFSLCEMDTVFNYNYNTLTGGELGEVATLYIAQDRINLYLIRDTLINENIGGLCAGSAGSIKNGNIYLKSLGALTHELGHFFGLAHTFSSAGDELVDGSNCTTTADGFCDTPADPYVPFEDLSDYIKDCIFISELKDANGAYYQPDVGNIMSYYGCDCGFTREQYLKMVQNYQNASKKHW